MAIPRPSPSYARPPPASFSRRHPHLSLPRPNTTDVITGDADNNVTDHIFEKMGYALHKRPDHPLGIIKAVIGDYFDEKFGKGEFATFDDVYPIVTAHANFDSVLVPPDHVSRSANDTYYVNKDTVLRCHTSAHQAEMLKDGARKFLVTGDVYRRDSIDATHFPVFHQMEGVRVFEPKEWEDAGVDAVDLASAELKETLEGLATHLLGDVETRWVDAYFPFTEPSYELEIFFKGEWLEVLGCGVMEMKILEDAGLGDKRAWAFGLGLERSHSEFEVKDPLPSPGIRPRFIVSSRLEISLYAPGVFRLYFHRYVSRALRVRYMGLASPSSALSAMSPGPRTIPALSLWMGHCCSTGSTLPLPACAKLGGSAPAG